MNYYYTYYTIRAEYKKAALYEHNTSGGPSYRYGGYVISYFWKVTSNGVVTFKIAAISNCNGTVTFKIG